MIRNHIRSGLRQIRKAPIFSFINIFGLALSMSVCLLVISLVTDQRSFDNFHPDADRIVRVTSTVNANQRQFPMATSSPMLAPTLLREDPRVEAGTRMRRTSGRFEREDGVLASFRGVYAEPSFFDLFIFKLSQGDAATALDNPYSVVLSTKLAETLFGDVDPIGRLLMRGEAGPFTVTGVAAPPPGRTHLKFDALVSFATLESITAAGDDVELESWENNSLYYNYLKLAPGANPSQLNAAINALGQRMRRDTNDPPAEYALQALTRINAGRDLSNQIAPVMSAAFVLILTILATILVVIALVNYVNLTISRASRRAREVGIRKAVGAQRSQVILQFVVEAVLTTGAAMLLAVLLLRWLIPQYNNLSMVREDGATILLSSLAPSLLIKFMLFTVILGVLAGVVPALRMSRFAPAQTLRGRIATVSRKRWTFRRGVVAFQFAASMVIVVVTVLAFHQFRYMLHADYGYDEAQLVHLDLQGVSYDTIRDELTALPGIEEVAATSSPPAVGSRTVTEVKADGLDEFTYILKYSVDEHFLSQYRIQLLAGRNLSRSFATDSASSVVLTESALKLLSLGTPEEAIGAQLEFDRNAYDSKVTVVGVVSDFYTSGFGDGFKPVLLTMRPQYYEYAAIRLRPERIKETLAGIDAIYARHAPGLVSSWSFFDDQLVSRMEQLRDTSVILGTFSFVIIAVALLGLLGMVSFAGETRRREAGLRKVLGATVGQVVGLLSREFVLLLGIALVVALPLATIVGRSLLSRFANQVDFGAAVYLTGIGPILVLALGTIAVLMLRTALVDPVRVIRNE